MPPDPQNPNAPQLTPDVLQQLLQMGTQQGSQLPPTPMASPPEGVLSATDPISQQMAATTQEGRQYMANSEATKRAQQAQLAQAIQAQQGIGPRSFQPTFKGRSTLGKIGEGLLTLGASTGLGQGIENVIYSKPREEYARSAATIKALQDAIKGTTESMSSEAGMTSKPIGAAGTYLRGAGIEESAQARMQQVANSLKLGMRGLDIKATVAKAQAGDLNADAAFKTALPEIYRQRIALGYDGNQVKEDIVNTLAQETQMDKFQLSTLVDSWLGTKLTPAAPQTPRGTQPEAGAQPMPPKAKSAAPAAKGGGLIYATDEKGVLHSAPAGTKLPKGWKPKQ